MPMQLVHTSDVFVSYLAKKAVSVCVRVREKETGKKKERQRKSVRACVCAGVYVCLYAFSVKSFVYECSVNVFAYEDMNMCMFV